MICYWKRTIAIGQQWSSTRVVDYHYLNGSLHSTACCYTAISLVKPIAFIAVVRMHMKAKYHRVGRLVVLPDYQGVGIGERLLNLVAELYASQLKILFYLLMSNPQLV